MKDDIKQIRATLETMFHVGGVDLPDENLSILELFGRLLTEARKNGVRDGNWIDKWGACRVCDGEIPYGHTDNCDIWKLEQRIYQLSKALEEIKGHLYTDQDLARCRGLAEDALK